MGILVCLGLVMLWNTAARVNDVTTTEVSLKEL